MLHDEHQGNRERRYRLMREVQALDYMEGSGTPRLYESNANAYNDQRQVLYAITEFIHGPTLSAAVNKKRFDIASARPCASTFQTRWNDSIRSGTSIAT